MTLSVFKSFLRFILSVGSLHLRKDRLGRVYEVRQASKYVVFRETVSAKQISEPPVVLLCGFRLKFIGRNRLGHWLFQRICILTTPFWSGFKGFKIKLWMVNPDNKNYLGIYEWLGEKNARAYINFLQPVLRFFSVKDSLWHRLFSPAKVDDYLKPSSWRTD